MPIVAFLKLTHCRATPSSTTTSSPSAGCISSSPRSTTLPPHPSKLLKEWLADFAIGNNATLKLVTDLVFLHENDFNEALKYTNADGTMELLLSVGLSYGKIEFDGLWFVVPGFCVVEDEVV
ncbi:Coatomer subunit epsilon-2 [Spatholobus suberectus]|nr:Coatomer subunit epsilon-2 [Spatholobus suberectus]